ncbi:MAG: polyprenyl synthetase family protein [Capsulimonadaceae bacterium]|nr:polyprenyl synthetase family protein [Capsulimonadaceae bacterium]
MTTAAQNRPAGTGASPEERFLSTVHEEMAAVASLLDDEIRSEVRSAYEISGHTLRAGGKRLRPAALILSARSVGRDFPAQMIYASSAAVELIHMASLIHDDVVDGAESRRGRPTANAAFGNQISVLVGDYLLAKSIYLAAREGHMDVIRIFSKVTVGLSEGEVLQITMRGNPDTTEQTYFDIIGRKTAGFISGCCEIGGLLAGADRPVVDALAEYGQNLGLAFQIADDLLDFQGDPVVTGKPRCSDLREGKMTLPLIAAYRRLPASSAFKVRVSGWIQNPDALSETDAEAVRRMIEEYGGYETARQAAVDLVDKARHQLEASVPPSPYRDSLAALASYSLGRDH